MVVSLCVVGDMFITAFVTKSAMSVVVPAHLGVPLDATVSGAVFCLTYFTYMLFLAVVLKLTITCLEVFQREWLPFLVSFFLLFTWK